MKGIIKHNNKIDLSSKSNNEKRIQSIDSIETYAQGISKVLIWKKEKKLDALV